MHSGTPRRPAADNAARPNRISRRTIGLAVLAGLVLVALQVSISSAGINPAPAFDKAFAPDAIGSGSTSTLTFTIDNSDSPGSPAEGLTFTDVLPTQISIQTPAGATNTCGGTLSAPDGGDTISLTDGRVGGGDSCTITVNVTASELGEGAYLNTTGDLTSSLGNSGTAEAGLTVDGSLPGFSKDFSPASIPLGSTSTLTFTIDNSYGGTQSFMSFFDALPAGMIVASPSSAATDCLAGSVTAVPGTSTISFSGAVLGEDTCTVTVDVTTTISGTFENSTFDLQVGLSPTVSAGFATAALDVPVQDLIKVFIDDPVAPGGTVTLEFTITNLSRTETLSGLGFTDVLTDALAGLSATPPPTPDPPCGDGSTLTGTTTLTLAGGTLPPEGSCTFSVPVTVPGNATPGSYTNTSSALSGLLGGEAFVGSTATDVLDVVAAPTLTKEFTDDPVGAGGTVTLHFELTDTSAGGSTDIAFVDDLTAYLPYPVSIASGLGTVCNGGTLSLIVPTTDADSLSLTGGSLASGATCSFDVEIDIPAGFPGGSYVNVADQLSATVGGETVFGLPAVDTLEVVDAPSLRKRFLNNWVLPGSTVTLEFTLGHSDLASADAVGIGFTDDLAAMASGLTVSLPSNPNPPCGPGSSLTGSAGDTFFTFAGATLSPGEECTFTVDVVVDAGAELGNNTNTTSDVTATVGGVAVSGAGAEDDLNVTPLTLAKAFTDDPVLPGGQVTLEFTLTLDVSSPTAATVITFRDDLDATLENLAAAAGALPLTEVCDPDGAGGDPGTGTLLGSSGDTFLSLSGASLDAGESCTFSVTLDVPGGAPAGTYVNATQINPNVYGGGTATIDSATVVFPPAVDSLVVELPLPPLLTKEFTDDPVLANEEVTLEFTITNPNAGDAMTDIEFDDDLEATLSGLAPAGPLPSDPCGAGSTLGFAGGNLSFTGGSLGAGGSCTFSVDLAVPGGTTNADYLNTTGDPTGTVNGYAVTGTAATDTLHVDIDADKDNVPDGVDNCPERRNPNQIDIDNDRIGNACDPDDDNDLVLDVDDNCPTNPNPGQEDNENDGIGDPCDPDDDNDGFTFGTDNCPFNYNIRQIDTDGDGKGNRCDRDDDGDGVGDVRDAFPLDPTEWIDRDGDGTGKNTDNCPNLFNPDQADNEGDGKGDECDVDDDNDGYWDTRDRFPFDPTRH